MDNYTAIEPSVYQKNILTAVEHGAGNLIVRAGPGSGKTTTLVMAAQVIKNPGIFCAFNKHVVNTLNTRLENTHMITRSIHSMGLSMIRHAHTKKITVDEEKYRTLVSEIISEGDIRIKKDDRAFLHSTLTSLAKYAMLSLTHPRDREGLRQVCSRFQIPYSDAAIDLLPELLSRGKSVAYHQGMISFDDMLWLPYIWNLTPKRRYPWVFLDECQDLNTAQIDVVMRYASKSGRVLAAGDPHQAIYAFAGADARSYENVKQRLEAREYPLPISYRCPKSHIRLLNDQNPHLRAAPDARPGTIQHIKEKDLPLLVTPGDIVLARANAPLISWCVQFIRGGIPSYMKGRDIGESLARILKSIVDEQGFRFTYADLPRYLKLYLSGRIRWLESREFSQAQIQALTDQISTLNILYKDTEFKQVDTLIGYVEELFQEKPDSVVCSTIHKFKGLEASRVIVLYAGDLPLTWPDQTDEQYQQEENILYVAMSRSTDTIIFLEKA